jgi:hypothetical protein
VHHGIDPEYVDKNYAGIFIIWDRLFGTYEPEVREPVYGTVKPVPTWNPLAANFAQWGELWRMSAATKPLVDKVRVWFAPPEWRPADLGGPVIVPPADPSREPRYDAKASKGIQRYVAVQFAIAAAGTVAYLWVESTASLVYLGECASVFLVTLVAWGGLLERRRWAWPLEVARLCAGGALVVVGLRLPTPTPTPTSTSTSTSTST